VRSKELNRAEYLSFWSTVGKTFPSLKGAVSTEYYFECERTLYEQFLPKLKDHMLLKTDLWNEAKNTEILRWAAERGARPYGVDIAFDIVHEATEVFGGHRPGFVVSDVRSLPFRADTRTHTRATSSPTSYCVAGSPESSSSTRTGSRSIGIRFTTRRSATGADAAIVVRAAISPMPGRPRAPRRSSVSGPTPTQEDSTRPFPKTCGTCRGLRHPRASVWHSYAPA